MLERVYSARLTALDMDHVFKTSGFTGLQGAGLKMRARLDIWGIYR